MAARHTHGKGLITDLTKYDNGVEFSLDTDRCCILVGPNMQEKHEIKISTTKYAELYSYHKLMCSIKVKVIMKQHHS